MNLFAVIFAICCWATTQARPGFSYGGGGGGGGHQHIQLEGVPNESHFQKISFASPGIIELGTEIKQSLPPAVVQINKKIIIKEPQPYPVKIPVPVPHPVEVAKPYPVFQTKIVKVPHPVPIEVIKKVPLPIEIPKPYPVPSEEFKAPHAESSGGSYGGSFSGGHDWGQHAAPEESQGGGYGGGQDSGFEGGYGGGYGGGFEGSEHAGGYAEADQSQNYQSQLPQNVGWVGLEHPGQQQIEEHQQ